jgi:hypothetical protein
MRKQVIFSVQDNELEMLDQEAKKNRLTRSAYIRKLVLNDVMRQAYPKIVRAVERADHGEG